MPASHLAIGCRTHLCNEPVRSHLARYEGAPLCGTSQLPAGHAPPIRMDALRVLVGRAVEAALLAAGFGRLLQFVGGTRRHADATCPMCALQCTGITATRDQRLHDLQCWEEQWLTNCG